jgi:hypothetical protein
MQLTQRRLLRLNDEILRLRREEELAAGELGFHRHLADDAIRDAVVSDLPEARGTAKDVARLQASLEDAREKIRRLEAKRDRLIARLQD